MKSLSYSFMWGTHQQLREITRYVSHLLSPPRVSFQTDFSPIEHTIYVKIEETRLGRRVIRQSTAIFVLA